MRAADELTHHYGNCKRHENLLARFAAGINDRRTIASAGHLRSGSSSIRARIRSRSLARHPIKLGIPAAYPAAPAFAAAAVALHLVRSDFSQSITSLFTRAASCAAGAARFAAPAGPDVVITFAPRRGEAFRILLTKFHRSRVGRRAIAHSRNGKRKRERRRESGGRQRARINGRSSLDGRQRGATTIYCFFERLIKPCAGCK